MTSSNTTNGVVLGASTTAAGVAVLPNTGGNILLTVFGIATLVAGVLVLTSFAATRVAGKFLR